MGGVLSSILNSCHWEVRTVPEHTGHHPTGQVHVSGALRSRASMSHPALPTPGGLVSRAPTQRPPRPPMAASASPWKSMPHARVQLAALPWVFVLPTQVSTGLHPSPAKPQPPGAQRSCSCGGQEATCCVYSPGSHGFPGRAPHLCSCKGLLSSTHSLLITRLMAPAHSPSAQCLPRSALSSPGILSHSLQP